MTERASEPPQLSRRNFIIGTAALLGVSACNEDEPINDGLLVPNISELQEFEPTDAQLDRIKETSVVVRSKDGACSGTIVTKDGKNFILSAGHCFIPEDNPQAFNCKDMEVVFRDGEIRPVISATAEFDSIIDMSVVSASIPKDIRPAKLGMHDWEWFRDRHFVAAGFPVREATEQRPRAFRAPDQPGPARNPVIFSAYGIGNGGQFASLPACLTGYRAFSDPEDLTSEWSSQKGGRGASGGGLWHGDTVVGVYDRFDSKPEARIKELEGEYNVRFDTTDPEVQNFLRGGLQVEYFSALSRVLPRLLKKAVQQC